MTSPQTSHHASVRTMAQTIRVFLLIQGSVFIAASLTHFGVLTHGYEHQRAGIAEGVIGTALWGALVLTVIRPASVRTIGLVVQTFALLGTAVGVVMVAIGIGPRTAPDIALHAAMVLTLVAGLMITVKSW
jgi:hypothetical protein